MSEIHANSVDDDSDVALNEYQREVCKFATLNVSRSTLLAAFNSKPRLARDQTRHEIDSH